MYKIGVVGCKGRVGRILVEELTSGHFKNVAFAGGTALPQDIEGTEHNFFITTDPAELFERADAVIDFTAPEATRKHAQLAAKHKKILVVGTTGLNAEDEAKLNDAGTETQIMYSANYSLAVNMLEALTEKAAAALKDYDIEITEAHHKHKVDAPSGTALMIGKAAAKARGQDFDKIAVLSREGITGPRQDGQIGFSTIRGGDAVGEHTVYFFGEGERLEIKQHATNRALYAKGAIQAAIWTRDQKPGLYSMRDVLNL